MFFLYGNSRFLTTHHANHGALAAGTYTGNSAVDLIITITTSAIFAATKTAATTAPPNEHGSSRQNGWNGRPWMQDICSFLLLLLFPALCCPTFRPHLVPRYSEQKLA